MNDDEPVGDRNKKVNQVQGGCLRKVPMQRKFMRR